MTATSSQSLYLNSIWDDINHDTETIAIEDFQYKPVSLSNLLYTIIDDSKQRKRVLLKNEIPGLYRDLSEIQIHSKQLSKSEALNSLIQEIFQPEKNHLVTDVDRLFLNAYYRRLLRAKLELAYKDKEIPAGLVITEYSNHESDASLVGTLKLLRLICRYLGIPNTITMAKFPLEKLYMPSLWRDVSAKFIQYFGENKIEPLETDDPFEINSITRLQMHEGMKKIRQSQVLMLLNIVFNTWSGSTLVLDDDQIKVIPATYVIRMLPLLKDLYV
jgi:hypothetical protein